MPHDDFTIICPYYYKTIGDAIFCEGVSAFSGANTDACYFKQEFKDKKSRNACLKRYCATFKYSDCRFATINAALQEIK